LLRITRFEHNTLTYHSYHSYINHPITLKHLHLTLSPNQAHLKLLSLTRHELYYISHSHNQDMMDLNILCSWIKSVRRNSKHMKIRSHDHTRIQDGINSKTLHRRI